MPVTTYKIMAAHVAERLRLRELKDRVPGLVESLTNYEMIVRIGENAYAFVYNYGSAVFFNVPETVQVQYLALIRETKEGAKIGDTSEVFLVEEKPDEIDPRTNKVSFDRVEMGKLSFPKIKIICMLVAESTALDYYDILIENLLERATVYTKNLEYRGKLIDSKDDLMKFVGMCLSAKQDIISNLYIVDSPDETWDNPELDKVFHELKSMLEIDIRYRAVEYKSKIIQESVEVIADLVKTKREFFLELVVIALITLEVVLGFIRH